MTQWGEPLPEREPGSRIEHVQFIKEMADGVPTTSTLATYRMHDQRIWVAKLTAFEIDVDGYLYIVVCKSTGCRTVQFLAKTFLQARLVAARFFNMSEDPYMRLVADAQGTSDHPLSVEIGAFRMTVVKMYAGGWNGSARTPRQHELTGIGRVHNSMLTIFPTTGELQLILDRVAGNSYRKARALVATGINTVGSADDGDAFADALNRVTPPTLTQEELDIALNRHRDDTIEDMVAGVASGHYEPRERAERFIDLGDRDEEPTTDG